MSGSTPNGTRGQQTPRRRFAIRDKLPTQSSTASNPASTSTEISVSVSNSQVISTSKPRFKFASRRPFLKSTSTTSTEAIPEEGEEEDHSEDQMIEPSIQRIRPHDTESNSISEVGTEINSNIQDTSLEILGDIALSLNPLHQAPLPTKRQKLVSSSTTTTTTTTTSRPQKNNVDRTRSRQRSKPKISTPTISTTESPVQQNSALRRRRPQPFEKVTQITPTQFTTGGYTPITLEYDYYDEGDVRIIGQLPANSKVLIHATGVIQCLDQGNFPHPVSCKKFISCAKMENGDVVGWEYTCPNRLSFDPVGGMCNWSAGLGCKEV